MQKQYKTKNYWIKKASKQSAKLPSERFKELIDDRLWPIVMEEIKNIKKYIKEVEGFNK